MRLIGLMFMAGSLLILMYLFLSEVKEVLTYSIPCDIHYEQDVRVFELDQRQVLILNQTISDEGSD
ncbi:hypothetical protein [Vibrio agarivorans]|uniref:hypothetical protein n=2 Tax=Vibrio agarivorans TaxID=153622 RepID=UPI002230DD50|nr:hypothetical protein [Vibrio agarivorans]MDN3659694.1 hypothetical protein [Vibrio agarivorans]